MENAWNAVREKLFERGRRRPVQFMEATQRDAQDCAGHWESCRWAAAKFTLFCWCIAHSSPPFSSPPSAVTLSKPPVMKLAHLPPNIPRVTPTQLDVALERPNVHVYLSSPKQLLRSAKKGVFLFFFFKSRLGASGCVRATQASVPNHPPHTHAHTHTSHDSTHQDSSSNKSISF